MAGWFIRIRPGCCINCSKCWRIRGRRRPFAIFGRGLRSCGRLCQVFYGQRPQNYRQVLKKLLTFSGLYSSIFFGRFSRHLRKCRNWQTSKTKDLVAFELCGFKSHLPHSVRSLDFQGFLYFQRAFPMSRAGSLFILTSTVTSTVTSTGCGRNFLFDIET